MSSFLRQYHLPLIAVGMIVATVTAGCSNGLVTSSPGADPSVTSPSAVSPSVGAVTSTTAPSSSPSAPSTSASRSSEPSTKPTAGDQTTTPYGGSASAGSRATSVCTLADLNVGVRASEGGGAAGSNYVLLTFRNKSRSTCTLYGYPGVSFVGMKNGSQLGVPAVRNRSVTPMTVRLAAGTTTTALLRIVNAGDYDPKSCAPTTSDGFRVYPPASKTSAYVPFQTQACQRDPGNSKQLTVSPVGTAG